MLVKTLVTQLEFEKIECNRCGVCCEDMILDFDPWKRYDDALTRMTRYYDATHEETVADLAFIKDMLIPLGKENNYACRHFKRDEEGLGVCTAYEKRPFMCSKFPYHQPSSFPGCSWNVRIVKKKLEMAHAR